MLKKTVTTKHDHHYRKAFRLVVKKNLFLKLMTKRGWIPETNRNKKTEVKNVEGINLKELLDEKNIKITLSDILTDYRYFKTEYYTVNLNPQEKKKELPFSIQDLSFKKVFQFYFVQEKAGNIMKTFYFLLLVNLITFIVQWRMRRLERLNEEILAKLDVNQEDAMEKSKHSNKKWNKV